MEIDKTKGHTLLVKCDCGWSRLLYCATRSVIEEEEHRITCCPDCEDEAILFVRTKGKYSLEEMRSLLNA